MELVNLEGFYREKVGTKQSRKLRRKNLIPAVFYGKGVSSTPIYVNLKDFENIIATSGKNTIINLTLKRNSSTENHTVMIKEIEEDHLKDTVLHIDFQAISLKETMEVKIPLEFVGEAKGTKEGGILEHLRWELEIECLPTEIPDSIKVDISNLGINQHIYVKDILLPENVKLLTEKEEIIVQVLPPKAEVEEVKVEEEKIEKEPEIIKEKKEEKEE